MNEWGSVQLSDLVEFRKGIKVEVFDDERPGTAPYIGASAIEGGATQFAAARGAVWAEPDDLLMLWDGERSGLIGGGLNGIVGSTVSRLRVRGLVTPPFLQHVLQSRFSWIQARRTGTGIPHVPKNIGAWLRIDLPSPPEQHRIAEILDAANEAIRSTEQVIAKLELAKQGLLHDLFIRGADSSGRIRAHHTRQPDLYRDTQLGWIPLDWTVYLLDDVSVRGSGHTPNRDIAAYWNGGIKWVSLADSARLDQIYITETDKEISDLGIANSSAVKHRAGTVILSRDAGVGKSAILAQEMAVSQHFMAWACGEKLDNHYFYYWLQFMKPRFEAIAMGSTIKTIGLPFFRRLTIPLPRIGQQKAAAAQLLAADADIIRHQIEARKQRLLKQGLMDDLLTGRVRVGASA